VNAAETAYLQGVDLYKQEVARLPEAFEYNSVWALGEAKPPHYICGGTVKAAHNPTYEMAYNAYVNRMDSPAKMPKTLEYLKKVTRASTNPVDSHMMIYETLTHGGSEREASQ
jgi:hypothetical protein